MNTTERLVESYFRQLGCFTASDVKVLRGNNRQFDILAYNFKKNQFYHIEVSVAHGINWAGSLQDYTDRIRYKFFGLPTNKRPGNLKTDFSKGKNYLNAIKETYSLFGIDYEKVIRGWCIWCLKEEVLTSDVDAWKQTLAIEFQLSSDNFELLLFRDTVLSTLHENIGTAHYDDELLRTLSLIKEYNNQRTNRSSIHDHKT